MFVLRPRFIITLAVASGLLAAYGVYFYLKQQEERTTNAAVPTFVSRRVVVSGADLSIGSMLTEGDLQVRLWPENLIPSGTHDKVEDLVGRVVKADLVLGEPVLDSKLAPEGSTGGVSSLIPQGMRAVTVAVNVVSGVGGFILPKTKVDVLVTVSFAGNAAEKSTRTILQNVEVLAVDQIYQKDDEDPMQVKSVTLLVSPEEAEKLALAATEGTLQLVMRSNADEEQFKGEGVILSELMGKLEKKVPQKTVKRPSPAPKPVTESVSNTTIVEIYRAQERSEVTFEEEGAPGTPPAEPNSDAGSKQ